MKFLCPACERLVPVGAHRSEGGQLFLTCSACGVESGTEKPAEAPRAAEIVQREDPFQVPDDRCPKCLSPRRPEASACMACGLSFAVANPADYRPPEALEKDWRLLLADWGRIEAHDRLLSAAYARGELPHVGRLYRLRLAEVPDDSQAVRGRDEVLRLASAPSVLQPTVPADPDANPPWKVALIVLLALTIVGLLGLLLRQLMNLKL